MPSQRAWFDDWNGRVYQRSPFAEGDIGACIKRSCYSLTILLSEAVLWNDVQTVEILRQVKRDGIRHFLRVTGTRPLKKEPPQLRNIGSALILELQH